MKKLNEMFSNVKTIILSMDKKNKTILGIIAVALIGAVTFGGYQLATIGKTVDSTVKQTDTTKKAEDSKKDSSTKKEDAKKEEKKQTDKKDSKKEETSKKKSTKKNNKEDGEKNTSTSTNEKSSSKKTNSSNTGNSSNKGTTSTNKGNSSNSGSSSSSGNNTSNSGNTGQNTKPAPAPKPTPKPEPEPTPEPALPQMTVSNIPSYLIGNSGRVFATRDEAYVWANGQVTTEGSPWFDYMMALEQPTDSDFTNSDSNPWTVTFYK
ncbi:hypothetical protein MKD03_10660 [[Clostridium] innocuum]|nr:hypothetical protein [[Clostridium] innocuum]MCR0459008.1 hypothetical protein [[Clostridium] innocuum]